MTETTFPSAGLDALPPPEVAAKAEVVGVTKAGLSAVTTLTLGVLAGAFIALGAIVSTVAATGGGELPFGVARLARGRRVLARPDPRRRCAAPSSSPATT